MAHALKDGRLVHVKAAEKTAVYHCPECGGRLVPVQGEIVRWHWRHQVEGSPCQYSGHGSETVAHLAAKEVLERDKWLIVPAGVVKVGRQKKESVPGVPGGLVRFHDVLVETRRGAIVPDLIGVLPDGRELLIEVFVSNRVDASKRAAIEAIGSPCVEIKMDPVDMNPHAGEVSWIYHPKIAALQAELDASYDAWLRRKRAKEAAEYQAQLDAIRREEDRVIEQRKSAEIEARRRRVEADAREREADARREEEARRAAEVFRRRQEARRQEEELRRQEEAARTAEIAARKAADEARRRAEREPAVVAFLRANARRYSLESWGGNPPEWAVRVAGMRGRMDALVEIGGAENEIAELVEAMREELRAAGRPVLF